MGARHGLLGKGLIKLYPIGPCCRDNLVHQFPSHTQQNRISQNNRRIRAGRSHTKAIERHIPDELSPSRLVEPLENVAWHTGRTKHRSNRMGAWRGSAPELGKFDEAILGVMDNARRNPRAAQEGRSAHHPRRGGKRSGGRITCIDRVHGQKTSQRIIISQPVLQAEHHSFLVRSGSQNVGKRPIVRRLQCDDEQIAHTHRLGRFINRRVNDKIAIDGFNLKSLAAHHLVITPHEEMDIEACLAQAGTVISPQGSCADDANFAAKRLMRFFHCHGSRFLNC